MAEKDRVEAPKARLLDSDAPTPAAEPEYIVDGKPVSREAYIEALPKAGYVPERMPENFFPAISTK